MTYRQTAADPDQSRYTCTAQGLTMFTKFWARSAKWGRIWGLGRVPDAEVFLSAIPDDFSAISQRPIFTKLGHKTWIVVETQILDICTQNPKLGAGQTGTSLRADYRCTVERYCLFRVHQGPGSFRGLVNFFVWRTVAELRGIKVAQFSDFGLFSHTKSLKSTFRWPAYSPVVTSQNDSDLSMW